MEGRETKQKMLNKNEMEQAAGGFEYNGILEWLRGHNIACPKCGNVNKGNFCSECGEKRPADAPLFRCDKCGWEPEDPKNPPKFCPQCGNRNSKESKFCTNCGYRFEAFPADEPAADEDAPAAEAEPETTDDPET